MSDLAYQAGASGWSILGKIALVIAFLIILVNHGLEWESTTLRPRLRQCEVTNQRLNRINKGLIRKNLELRDKLAATEQAKRVWQAQALVYHNHVMGFEDITQVEGLEKRAN